jgi:flagellar biogenesis protein FliO
MPLWAQQAPLREAPSAIPFKQEGNVADQLWRVAFLLVGVGGLFVGGTYVYKRFARDLGISRGRRLRLLESMRLTPKSAVFLLQVDDQTILIGQQGEGLSVLLSRSVASENAPLK